MIAQTSMNFQDCYKILIKTLFQWDNITNMKILDQCVDSNDETVIIYQWIPIVAKADNFFLGTG
jgi:hypothetical protein